MQNDSFENKYDLYGEMLYKIAFLYFGNAHDAEDAIQEVFIKYLSRRPAFKSNEHEKAWLIRTTQNQCIDMLRAASRKTISLDDIHLPAKMDDHDLRIDIISKIIALPHQYKSALILYYYYDYSVAEIAKTLKLSTSAVKMRLKRGRDILKIELEEHNNEER